MRPWSQANPKIMVHRLREKLGGISHNNHIPTLPRGMMTFRQAHAYQLFQPLTIRNPLWNPHKACQVPTKSEVYSDEK